MSKTLAVRSQTVVSLDADRLGHLLDLAVKAEEHIKQLREYARAQLDAGNPVRGWKLVAGRGRKEWRDEAEAEALLSALVGEEAVISVRKVVTPAHALGLVAKEDREAVEELIVRTVGSPVMAPESDKRPAVELTSAQEEFAVVADPEE